MREKHAVINISRVSAPILGSRDIINDLKQLIIKASTKRVDLDFQRVKFVSRSAAHELLKLKEELFYRKRGKKEIRFVNTDNSVARMLRIVASNRAIPKKEIPKSKIESINITSLAR